MKTKSVAAERRAFTLVELLVVIGIIALLISILLPTLRRARQAADAAACLSNLRQIGQGMMMYKSDVGRIPFFFSLRNYPWQPVAPGATGNAVWWTAFSFGGKTTHDSISIGYIDDNSKPLDRYVYKDLAPEPWLGTKTPAAKRVERDVFRCPADDGGGMGRGYGLPVDYLAPGVGSPYQAYGTSYMSNRGFMNDPDIVALYYKCMTLPYTHEKVNYFNAGISKIVKSWPSSETIVCADIWFLWSTFYHVALPGAHSSQSIHNALFLDGHAAPAYITQRDVQRWGTRNTSRYTSKDGDGWRETGNSNTSRYGYTVGNQTTPWNGTDPMGGSNNKQGTTPG